VMMKTMKPTAVKVETASIPKLRSKASWSDLDDTMDFSQPIVFFDRPVAYGSSSEDEELVPVSSTVSEIDSIKTKSSITAEASMQRAFTKQYFVDSGFVPSSETSPRSSYGVDSPLMSSAKLQRSAGISTSDEDWSSLRAKKRFMHLRSFKTDHEEELMFAMDSLEI